MFDESGSQQQKPTFSDYDYWKTTGDEVVGFYAKQRAGELLPVNSYRQLRSKSTFSGSRTYTSYTQQTGGDVITNYNQPLPHTNNWPYTPPENYVTFTQSGLENRLDAAVIDNLTTRAIVGIQSSVHDSLTFVAEFHKVVSMFRNAGNTLAKLTSKTDPKDWSSLWLEGRYGWRTLWYDMNSVNDAIRHLERSGDFYRKVAGQSESFDETQEFDHTLLNAEMKNVINSTFHVNYRGFAVSKIVPPAFGGDILDTAWELIPWSFVVDWFVDIGFKISYISGRWTEADYVSGYGTKITGNALWTNYIDSKSGRTNIGGSWYDLDSNTAVVVMEAELLVREPFTPSLSPNLNIRLDDFKIVDLISLITQIFWAPKSARKINPRNDKGAWTKDLNDLRKRFLRGF
jgi:hypothetical protein